MKKNNYWFRSRNGLFSTDLGYGWTPISWEGWLLTLIFVILLISIIRFLNDIDRIISFAISLFVFMYIADARSQKKILFK